MKISILTPDFSQNCLGRSYILAKILQRHYEVEIIGPIFGDSIWAPVAEDESIIYKHVKIKNGVRSYAQILSLIGKIDGDVIYANKPLLTSFGIGILTKILKKKYLILDIDDWELGFSKEQIKHLRLVEKLKILIWSLLYIYNIGSYWNRFLCDKITKFADEITVSNRFLKDKFGGTIIYHGRDTEVFDVRNYDKKSLLKKYDIPPGRKIAIFLGTPRAHKGIEDLIDAINLIKNKDVILLIVGIDRRDKYCLQLVGMARAILGKRFIEFGMEPFEKVPEFLAISDVVIVPQRDNLATIGQLPAKIFDAMAMERPIIITRNSSLLEVLEGCSWIAEQGDPKQLATLIEYVLEPHNNIAEGCKEARRRCVEMYSWDAMEKELINVLRRYEVYGN